MDTAKKKPSILSFIDYRLFLQAWYSYNKEHQTGFSFTTWTKKCGFKSRSHIRLIMIGQRVLSADTIAQVLKSLNLTSTESEYFEHLVHYAHASNIRTKEYHFQQILRLNKGQLGVRVRDVYKFLSNPKTPRVHFLLGIKGLQCTLPYVAETMNITHAEALEILENIEACGLADYDETTKTWVNTEANLQIPDELGNTAIQAYHLNSLTEAEGAIAKPPTERFFNATLMTLDPEEYQELQRDIDQFHNFLTKKYASAKLKNSRIFQMNLNIIPTSGILENASPQPQPKTTSEAIADMETLT